MAVPMPDSASDIASTASRLCDLMTDLGRRWPLRDPISPGCEGMQLTGPQIHCLWWMGRDVGLAMSDLASRLGITEKTVTGLVDRLEQAGYVGRERDTQDRRVVRLRLTGTGQTAADHIEKHVRQRLIELAQILPSEDRAMLLGILERLCRRLAGDGPAASEESPT